MIDFNSPWTHLGLLILLVLLELWLTKRILSRKDCLEYSFKRMEDIKKMSDMEWNSENLYNLLHHDLCDLFERALKFKAATRKFKKAYWQAYDYVKKNLVELKQWEREEGGMLSPAKFADYRAQYRLAYNG